MTIKVTHPSGATIEFPEGTDEQTIIGAMSQIGGQQPEQPQPQPQPQKQPQSWGEWAKDLYYGKQDPKFKDLPSVYSQQKDFGPVQRAADTAANFGASDEQLADVYKKQLGDRFRGLETDANGYTVIRFVRDDGQEVAGYVNKPGLDMGDVVRGVRGALPHVGLAALTGGSSLAGQAIAQGVGGAALSVGGDLAQIPLGSEQGIEGDKALATGILGGAAPLAGRAIGNTYNYVKDRMVPKGGALQGLDSNAVNRVRALMDSDKTDYYTHSKALGPEGMLADMGDNARMATARIARNPGEGRSLVSGMVDNRRDFAPARIKQDIDAGLGPAINLPRYAEKSAAEYRRMADPFYKTFHNSQIMVTPRFEQLFKRAEAIGATKQARQLMDADGVQLPQGHPDVRSGLEIDYVKRAIDDLAREAPPGSNQQRIFANLARDIRNEVDDVLSPGSPTQSPWFKGRAISGQGIEGTEAAELGGKVFSSQRDPHVVQAELDDLSLYGQAMYKAGSRNDARQIMGRAGAAYGPKGDVAARQKFNSEFNRENLKLIAGSKGADRITRRIDAENQFAELYDMVKSNSITSTMKAAEKMVPGPVNSTMASEAGKKGPMGLATELAFKIANLATNGALNARNERIAADMARMLVAQGAKRDRIVQALMEMGRSRKLNAEQAKAIGRIVNAIGTTSRQPAASAVAGGE